MLAQTMSSVSRAAAASINRPGRDVPTSLPQARRSASESWRAATSQHSSGGCRTFRGPVVAARRFGGRSLSEICIHISDRPRRRDFPKLVYTFRTLAGSRGKTTWRNPGNPRNEPASTHAAVSSQLQKSRLTPSHTFSHVFLNAGYLRRRVFRRSLAVQRAQPHVWRAIPVLRARGSGHSQSGRGASPRRTRRRSRSTGKTVLSSRVGAKSSRDIPITRPPLCRAHSARVGWYSPAFTPKRQRIGAAAWPSRRQSLGAMPMLLGSSTRPSIARCCRVTESLSDSRHARPGGMDQMPAPHSRRSRRAASPHRRRTSSSTRAFANSARRRSRPDHRQPRSSA